MAVVSWIIVVALAVTALGASIAPLERTGVEVSRCGRVWLTVHSPDISTGNGQLLDALELNWDFLGCSSIPARIGLFNGQPTSWNTALVTYSITELAGYVITHISLGDGDLPAGWNSGPGPKGPHCLWPGVAAGSEIIESVNCLKIQPTWMEDNAHRINHLRIGDLALPGTHNSGAWRFDTGLVSLSRDRFTLCQDRSIWAQLVHGIRYFDFRIGYSGLFPNEDDRYWLNHNLVRVRPLVPLLREIRMFLELTKEVVFFDAHHFPVGFYDSNGAPLRDIHAGFIRIVERELGPYIALHTEFGTGVGTKGPTLQSLIDADKRLVFSYVDNTIVAENPWLWPNLPHLWAQTNDPVQLFQFLDQAIANSPQANARSPMHAAMAQTTPSTQDVIFLRGSLRESADAVNRNVTSRLSNLWKERANIVATDFFLGNDVVDVSIMISVERGGR